VHAQSGRHSSIIALCNWTSMQHVIFRLGGGNLLFGRGKLLFGRGKLA
jgi:hypothetical protein